MSESELRRIALAVMVVILAVTYPSWASQAADPPVTYDAPWIYPGLNPTVRAQLERQNAPAPPLHKISQL